jgi:hypothetical protein
LVDLFQPFLCQFSTIQCGGIEQNKKRQTGELMKLNGPQLLTG